MVTDARTEQGNVPKADPDGNKNVNDAIHRFNFAMEFLGAALVELNGSLNAKADQEHQHTIDDIAELGGQLQSLTDGLNGHTHAFSDLVDVDLEGATEGQLLQFSAGKVQAVAARAEYLSHRRIEGLTSSDIQSALAQLVHILKDKADKTALEEVRADVFGFNRVNGHLHYTQTREPCAASDFACFAVLPGTVTFQLDDSGHLIMNNEGLSHAD